MALLYITSLQDKEVRLVAKVVPASEVSGRSAWNYKCLRLMCERLYSLTDCYSVHDSLATESSDGIDRAILEVGCSGVLRLHSLKFS